LDKQKFLADFVSANYPFGQFKNDIQSALESKFGAGLVVRKNKCIRIIANNYRVNADIVPCFLHERFRSLGNVEAKGIEFITDAGIHIIGFPEQHYDNGVIKNDATNRRYKSITRILKNIRNDLVDNGTITSEAMPSFFLECLAWNVSPNDLFQKYTYADATRSIIATTWNEMGDPEKANNYAEVSDLLWLFRGSPNRKHQQARDFLQKAYNFIGYED